jgi:hypothetical protein
MLHSAAGGILFFSAVALVLIVSFIVYRQRWNARVRRMLLSRWGEESERRISADELLSIRAQAQALAGGAGFSVDDVTWNDLDMDRLYAGDAVLYGMLRNPLRDAADLRRRGGVMAWAKADAGGREKVKRVLYDLGRTGGIDLDAMFERNWFSRRNWLGCIAMAAALVVSVLLCALGFAWAVVLLLLVTAANVTIHFRSRRFAGRYFSVYRYVPVVLAAAKRITRLNIPELDDMNDRLAELLGRVKGILGNQALNSYYSFNNRTVNNPADILVATLNVFFLIDLISLYNLSRQIFRYKDEIMEVFALLGELDGLIATASWRETLDAWCEPALDVKSGKSIRAEGLVHPLLRGAVPNDADIGRNMLLTGSNATGKSTFLKAVAMNAILAQSFLTCAAISWQGSFFRVYTSMALRDDLFSDESYFVTEIKSLKRMLDGTGGEAPSLCIVDEVLRGTNTGERIAAASEALLRFSRSDCLCLAATHDIELTYILEGVFENMHFSETIRDGGIEFDYKLKPGRSTSRNAIKLLGLLGYGKDLVDAAGARLEEFEKTGKWGRARSPMAYL